MTCIAHIASSISVRFKHWMREPNWPLWLWMTDADSNCNPVTIHRDPDYKGGKVPFGTDSSNVVPCAP